MSQKTSITSLADNKYIAKQSGPYGTILFKLQNMWWCVSLWYESWEPHMNWLSIDCWSHHCPCAQTLSLTLSLYLLSIHLFFSLLSHCHSLSSYLSICLSRLFTFPFWGWIPLKKKASPRIWATASKWLVHLSGASRASLREKSWRTGERKVEENRAKKKMEGKGTKKEDTKFKFIFLLIIR